MKAVDVLRVAKVSSAYGGRQRTFGVGYRNNVDMIAHQTITDDIQAVSVCVLFQKLQIHPAVVIHKEHVLAVIAPLSDMVSRPDRHYSC
jgi:hypothetical protein